MPGAFIIWMGQTKVSKRIKRNIVLEKDYRPKIA